MRAKLHKILITGGAGFIGSAFVRLLAGENKRKGRSLIVVDKLTYAGDLARLKEVRNNFKFYKADICDKKQIELIFAKEKPGIVVNFSAETHVDRSIKDPVPFTTTNICGTQVLLDASMRCGVRKFIHISTDEVYGDIIRGKFSEDSTFKPSSPYAASKAAADLLIKSYIRTYNFPAVIIRPSNNYGPWQYPEKLIPLSILKILRQKKIPIYARGKNVREWLFVEDCAKGILKILNKGKLGEVYNLGSDQEKQNIQVISKLLKVMRADKNLIEFVKDRPGHDIRYRLNSAKIIKSLGWRPNITLEQGLSITVDWALSHKDWLLSKQHNIPSLYK